MESAAGVGSGFTDDSYRAIGAEVIEGPDDVWRQAELLVKVKEPFAVTKPRSGQIVFTYLHLAPNPELTRALQESGCVAIAYETVQLADGSLPLLIPMSQIAGRMATGVAAQWLRKPGPVRGKLLGGLPWALPARVVILGAGTVSTNAGRVKTLISTPYSIARSVAGADVLIGGVLMAGEVAPKLVREQVRSMGGGAVIVDVDIDQGGCVDTARPR